jgi:hypothetical protein
VGAGRHNSVTRAWTPSPRPAAATSATGNIVKALGIAIEVADEEAQDGEQ